MSVFCFVSGYTVKHSLSPQEIIQAKFHSASHSEDIFTKEPVICLQCVVIWRGIQSNIAVNVLSFLLYSRPGQSQGRLRGCSTNSVVTDYFVDFVNSIRGYCSCNNPLARGWAVHIWCCQAQTLGFNLYPILK